MMASLRSRPGLLIFYLSETGAASLPLLGYERRRPLAEGLLPLPLVRDDQGLLLVQAETVTGEDGKVWEERHYLRVL